MTLLPNGTMQNGSLAQVMLAAVCLNLIYTFVIIVDALLFVCSQRFITCIKRMISALCENTFIEPLKIPQHMAVVFGDDDSFSLSLLCDFIVRAANSGVRQLTFYDSKGVIVDLLNQDALENFFIKNSSQQLLERQQVCFQKLSAMSTLLSDGLVVGALSRRHGKETLIQICAELSQSADQISLDAVTMHLNSKGIHEVDFLVTVGCSNTLDDFPPWTLRLTEILHLDQLDNRFYLKENEFNAMLRAFSIRERRMGY